MTDFIESFLTIFIIGIAAIFYMVLAIVLVYAVISTIMILIEAHKNRKK